MATHRAHYHDAIEAFLERSSEHVCGALANRSDFDVERPQLRAWAAQIGLLQPVLRPYSNRGHVFFEFVLPRVGRRIDVVVVIDHVVFVIEFKVGESEFQRHAIDQVWDYALDLKNFHGPSHHVPIAPVLVATGAAAAELVYGRPAPDGVLVPISVSASQLGLAFEMVLARTTGARIDGAAWGLGRYSPTPNIIEAARALYRRHSVSEISRSDAGATNLTRTSKYVSGVIAHARREGKKVVCLLTGVPGAGKTLVGLDIAAQHMEPGTELYSVFLSGNGPLVAILKEVLTRDRVEQERQLGRTMSKAAARREVESFIQNVHHFRDDCLTDPKAPPEHVAVFDEAQRAWDRPQTIAFMTRKKGRPDFDASEPEFLLSCMDRHDDWAVVLCLVGGGQEINTGEAGISEWLKALRTQFPEWSVHISPRLQDQEYASGAALAELDGHPSVTFDDALHLSVSMRSFRSERVSDWVKFVLDLEVARARETLEQLLPRFPIVVTRDLAAAKAWVRAQARGTERFGLVVSSQAQRLKAHAIDVRVEVDPVHWFLGPKDDVRSSYYLEDAASEFQVQGLELDWACVVWDADFRKVGPNWEHWSFRGSRWQRVNKPDRRSYLKNAYRVLLTRARQGMALVVPHGDVDDPTRDASFYDETYAYLRRVGVPPLEQAA
ncbi:MAG: DUF2075 domain-containing protein [Rubrivivax sp.]|nr:DUF2075 domain-containing protein [Rubrivivax sp.]